MNDSQRIQMLRALFTAHQTHCPKCHHYQGSSGDLRYLCYEGIQQFKAILDATDKAFTKTRDNRKLCRVAWEQELKQ